MKFNGPFKEPNYEETVQIVTAVTLKRPVPLQSSGWGETVMGYQDFANGGVSQARRKIDQKGCYLYGNFVAKNELEQSVVRPYPAGPDRVTAGLVSSEGREFKNQKIEFPIDHADGKRFWAELNCTSTDLRTSFKDSVKEDAGSYFEIE